MNNISKETLKKHHCLEKIDVIPNDPESTYFRKRTRLHQSIWREKQNLPIGTQPISPKEGQQFRNLGSRVDISYARNTLCNFMADQTKMAVINRIDHPEPKQTMYEDRLYADLLSSMPMCFNLFGPLTKDLKRADKVIKTWWPDTPGKLSAIRFEWSPGRQIKGRLLENRSAFDVAFELQMPNNTMGIIGVETKYHEVCNSSSLPSEKRLARYQFVADKSGVFSPISTSTLIGTHLQQIWLDHLLSLSMIQDTKSSYTWAKFVLVFPEKNPSFMRASQEYELHLREPDTFQSRSIESLLSASRYPQEQKQEFSDRYIW